MLLKLAYFCLCQNVSHRIKVYSFNIIRKRLKIIGNRFCTIYKIKMINLQTTRTWRFKQSWKLCPNLCLLRWLQPKRKGVSNFNPIGSNILYTLLWIGRMKDNSLLLNIARDSEFLIEAFKLSKSFKVKGKKEYLKQFFLNIFSLCKRCGQRTQMYLFLCFSDTL